MFMKEEIILQNDVKSSQIVTAVLNNYNKKGRFPHYNVIKRGCSVLYTRLAFSCIIEVFLPVNLLIRYRLLPTMLRPGRRPHVLPERVVDDGEG